MTTQTVTRQCGCETNFDTTGLAPFQLKDKQTFFERTKCPRCDPKLKAKNDRERAAYQAQELAEAQEAEERAGYEALRGSPRQVDWATKVRVQLIQAAFEALGLEETEFNTAVGDPAGRIDSASWWIENRETPPEDLPTAIAEALGTSASGNENPF